MKFTERQRTRAAASVLIGILIAIAVSAMLSENSKPLVGEVLGGDFLPFYTAGEMVLQGKSSALYRLADQFAVQRTLAPQTVGNLYFPYPPFVALLMVPFALLPYSWAAVLFVLLNLSALALAIHLLQRGEELKSFSTVELLALSILFYPLFRAILSGQNTALSLLCLAGMAYALRTKLEPLAGVALGLWLFKPHFALLPLSWLICSGRFRVLWGFLPAASLLYVSTAILFGGTWPIDWLRAVQAEWIPLEHVANSSGFISILGVSEALFGRGDARALFIGGTTTLLVWAVGLRWFVRNSGDSLLALSSLSGILITLIAPHVMWYDLGLVLPAMLLLLRRGEHHTLLLLWLFSWVSATISLPVSPLFFLLLAVVLTTKSTLLNEKSRTLL